jgi:predicted small lipoprotein YifL
MSGLAERLAILLLLLLVQMTGGGLEKGALDVPNAAPLVPDTVKLASMEEAARQSELCAATER